MADVSRSVYLSRKFSNVNEDSSKHVYDGIFSAPAAAKQNASSFAARIEEYREIFPPSNASLGFTIPILDLPASDRSVGLGRGVSSDFDYAGVFGGLGDNDGIEVATEKFFSDSNKSVKRDAHPPRIPVPTRRTPSKSQEFSFRHGNDQTSSPEKPRRIPYKSQEFSCNYGNDQTLNPARRMVPSRSQEFVINHGNEQTSSSAQARRVPSKSQEFVINHGNDQTSSSAQARKMPSPSQEISSNYVNDQISSPGKTKSQESSIDPGNDQTSIPAQTRRIPSKSQEFSSNYGNNEASTPVQLRRIPSKSQEFQIPIPSHSKKQYSQSQEFPSNFSINQTSASALPHETVDSVKHVSFSYNKTNQLGKDSPNGTTHIAHLHAVPGYTHLFDESGPVKKPSIDKPKRLSMDDADFGKVSKQGKHLRAVSDLGTNQQAMDLDKEVNRSMSMSNSPQSFGSSGYFKRSSRRRRSKNNQENIAYVDPFLLLEDELDVNSTAAVSAAAMKKAIEEAEMKIRWAKDFLKNLEGNGFIKPTLKDSFKVNVEVNAFGLKQNVSMKVKPMKQKKYFNEEKVLKQNSYLNREASVGDSHANKAVEVKSTVGVSAGVDSNLRNPATEKCEEMNVNDELKFDEKRCKDESGGEWEAAKQLSQLFTGVKNRFVSFMSKQAEAEKTVIQSKSETVDKVEDNLDHTVEMSAHDCVKTSIDMEICEEKDHEVSTRMVSEPEEEVECIEAYDVKQDIATEVKGEALQEVEEQNEEMLDVKLEMQNENQMDTTVPVERDELEENVCQSEEQDNEMRNQEDNEEIVDVVPDLEQSLNKEAMTELEMPKDAELKRDVVVEECSGRTEEEEENYGGKEDTEKITGQDVTIEAAECLTEVVDDETNELFLSKNQEANQNVEGIKLISEEKGRMTKSATIFFELKEDVDKASELNEIVCEQTSCSIDVVDEDSEHEEYLPAVDDILEQYEAAAIDEDLPSQKERLTVATSATFEHEGNTERLTSVEMVDQLNEECISDDSVSHTEGADESLEHTSDDLCEKYGPEEHQCAQEDKVYVENDLIGEIKDTSMSSGDISDLDDTEKETKEADDVASSIDAEITELDSVLKYEQKLSDEDDESEEANEQDASSQNTELSHKRRRWFVSTDEVTSFQQPGIFQGTTNSVDEIVNNSGEQGDGDSDQDQRTEGSQSTEGGSHRRRRWFENSIEKVEVKHDFGSETVERKEVTDDKAGHRRRRWFENSQKPEDSDSTTTKQEPNETSSEEEESANAQQESEEQSKARERQAVERAIREARQRAFAEAKERANAVKAAAAASASVKPLSDRASIDAKLRAERAAVERATAEARERSLQKSMSEKVIYKSREKVEFKNLNSGPSSSGNSTSVPFTSDRPSGAMTESPQRRKAISERNKRTTERAAKALEEKNMRDVLAQKEQAERNRFAGILDAEVKRWSTGKEGNLRSLLSTLQYVLGPDSGWQPIPLTDLVTTTAVRKAYKRAALCVHPDKLQQRRATIQHKYICEKVFDLLKDAWHKFNPDER